MSGVLHAMTFTAAGFTPVLDANTVFLLRAGPTANTFTDVSSAGRTVTNNGSVTTSTSTVKFTNSVSGFFGTPSSNYLSVADAAALRPGSGAFTWEFWWYPTSLVGYQTPIAKGYVSSGDLTFQTGFSDGTIIVYVSGAAIITSSTAVTTNTWHHVALTRSSNTWTLWQNGASVGTATNSGNLNGTGNLFIGAAGSNSPLYGVAAYMQDVRLSDTARYSATFTPPSRLT